MKGSLNPIKACTSQSNFIVSNMYIVDKSKRLYSRLTEKHGIVSTINNGICTVTTFIVYPSMTLAWFDNIINTNYERLQIHTQPNNVLAKTQEIFS